MATVVFVHGAMDRAASFQRVARRLPEVTVVTYDRRGYNESLHLPPTGDINRHAADLARVIGTEPSVVIGHSFGALIALVAAQHHRGLVVALGCYEPPGPWLPWWRAASEDGRPEDPGELAEWFMRRTIGDSAWERLDAAVRDRRRREGHALRGDLEAAAVRPYEAEEILVPTSFGYGQASPGHYRRSASEQAMEVPGAVVVEVPGAAHGAHLSRPDAFSGFARQVMASAPGRDGA